MEQQAKGELRTLRLIAGKTYMSPSIFGPTKIIERGQEVSVTDEQAELLLKDFYKDPSNNEHYYWAEVGSEAAPRPGEQVKPAQAARRVRRPIPDREEAETPPTPSRDGDEKSGARRVRK